MAKAMNCGLRSRVLILRRGRKNCQPDVARILNATLEDAMTMEADKPFGHRTKFTRVMVTITGCLKRRAKDSTKPDP